MKTLLVALVLLVMSSPAAIAQQPPVEVPEATAVRADVGEPGPAFQRGSQDLDMAAFIAAVMQDVNAEWATIFAAWDRPYVPPRYVAVETGAYAMSNCGINAGHPADHDSYSPVFYCPYGGALGTQVVDSREVLETTRTFEPVIYVSLSWLEERFAADDIDPAFGIAYVMTHQVGLHVESLLGYTNHLGEGRRDVSDAQVSLWATCLSGVWAFSAYDTGTLPEAEVAAALATSWGGPEDRPRQFGLGDDAGTPEDQLAFFMAGYTSGSPAACFATEVGT